MKLYPTWLKKSLYHFREFFWPLIDEPEVELITEGDQQPDDHEILISDENIKKAFELNTKISDSEDSRRASIESKATSLISAIGISSSIVVATSALAINSKENIEAIRITVIIAFVLTIYTLRTVWFAVRALERKGYHGINFSDINMPGDENEYHRKLMVKISEMTIKNQDVINEKVDNLVLAQEYYKRGIIVIFLYAFFALSYCLFFKDDPQPMPPATNYHYLEQITDNHSYTLYFVSEQAYDFN